MKNIFLFFRRATVLALILLIVAPNTSFAAADVHASTTLSQNLDNVVNIWCGYMDEENNPQIIAQGSGVVLDDTEILTNAHVVFYYDEADPESIYYYDFCVGGIAENSYTEPLPQFNLSYDAYHFDDTFDYAFMTAYDDNGNPWTFDSAITYGNADSLVHGDDLTLVGYPGAAGSTITATFGAVSGFEDDVWIKTDAVAEFGSSGGGAFDALGNLIGLPTLLLVGEANSFTLIQNLNAIIEDAYVEGTIERDYDHLYEAENVVCFSWGECYNYGEDEVVNLDEGVIDENTDDSTVEDVVAEPEPVVSLGSEIEEGKYEDAKRDQKLIDRMLGSILLQVELHGEAWYVNPTDGLRYYMRDGAVAYEMMRSFGLGITDDDLSTIPAVETTDAMKSASSVCQTNSTANRLKGRILLQVEQHGEAWWISPTTCRRIYLKDGAAAYEIMRYLSTGITNYDLTKMPTGDIQ